VIAHDEMVEGQNVRRTEGTFCRELPVVGLGVNHDNPAKLLSMWYVLILLLGDRRVPGRRVQLMHKAIRLTMQRLSAMHILKRRQGGGDKAAACCFWPHFD
jgi:hypothetical protein